MIARLNIKNRNDIKNNGRKNNTVHVRKGSGASRASKLLSVYSSALRSDNNTPTAAWLYIYSSFMGEAAVTSFLDETPQLLYVSAPVLEDVPERMTSIGSYTISTRKSLFFRLFLRDGID